jgi:glycyl-tRNA synthetase
MAEIEHFVNPKDKTHPNFYKVKDKKLNLFDAVSQLGSGKISVMTIGEAVAKKTVDNETLGYFMTRTQLFMERVSKNLVPL